MAPPSFICCKLSVSVGALLRSVMRSARPKGRPGAQETIKELIYTQLYFRWQTAECAPRCAASCAASCTPGFETRTGVLCRHRQRGCSVTSSCRSLASRLVRELNKQAQTTTGATHTRLTMTTARERSRNSMRKGHAQIAAVAGTARGCIGANSR